MAVYTEVSAEDLSALLAQYDIGTLSSLKGIAEGVENSNFILETIRDGADISAGAGQALHQRFILTLYEKRVDPADLPFFLGLMEHLARNGLNCPLPVRARTGSALARLAGKPAAIITFLDGVSYRRPSVAHCAELGRALARLHRAGADFPMRRANALALAGWRPLAERAGARADDVAQGLGAMIADELAFLDANWPKNLPQGIIHADLFPNNVLFLGDKLTGVIDFYFACTDFYAYDLAICLNAWCFEADFSYNITKGAAMIAAYLAERPLTPGEIAALPVLARGAALRFLLTRLVDWLNVPAGALVKPLDPLDYMKRLRFHRRTADAAGYGA